MPDVCLIQRGGPREQVLIHAPLAAIEVLVEEDRFSAFMEKSADYRRFGIEHNWIVDPESQLACKSTSTGLEAVHFCELTEPETPTRVIPAEIFAELDRPWQISTPNVGRKQRKKCPSTMKLSLENPSR